MRAKGLGAQMNAGKPQVDATIMKARDVWAIAWTQGPGGSRSISRAKSALVRELKAVFWNWS